MATHTKKNKQSYIFSLFLLVDKYLSIIVIIRLLLFEFWNSCWLLNVYMRQRNKLKKKKLKKRVNTVILKYQGKAAVVENVFTFLTSQVFASLFSLFFRLFFFFSLIFVVHCKYKFNCCYFKNWCLEKKQLKFFFPSRSLFLFSWAFFTRGYSIYTHYLRAY